MLFYRLNGDLQPTEKRISDSILNVDNIAFLGKHQQNRWIQNPDLKWEFIPCNCMKFSQPTKIWNLTKKIIKPFCKQGTEPYVPQLKWIINCIKLCSFTSFRWKMPAARAADAFVFLKTSEKCSTAPAPLLAITGMLTASEINFIRSISNPFPWPESPTWKHYVHGRKQKNLVWKKYYYKWSVVFLYDLHSINILQLSTQNRNINQ